MKIVNDSRARLHVPLLYEFKFPVRVAAGTKDIDFENANTPEHFERDRLIPAQLERDCTYPYSLPEINLQHGEKLKEVIFRPIFGLMFLVLQLSRLYVVLTEFLPNGKNR